MTDFKEFERNAWEQKAAGYDNTWGRVSSQAISHILDLAEPLEGKTLFDCGCGPGHLCALAEIRGAKAIGGDYSNRMVEIAKHKYPAIDFCHEDAEALSFPAASFDVVTMNFLLLHVSNQEKALKEGTRVLSKDGKLIFTMWLPPQESPGLGLIFRAIKEFADLSVIPPAEDIFAFSDEVRCRDFLQQLGFSQIDTARLDTFWEVSSPEEFFTAVQAGTRMGGLIDLQQAEIKAKIQRQIFAQIETFKQADRYIIPTPSLVVVGSKA